MNIKITKVVLVLFLSLLLCGAIRVDNLTSEQIVKYAVAHNIEWKTVYPWKADESGMYSRDNPDLENPYIMINIGQKIAHKAFPSCHWVEPNSYIPEYKKIKKWLEVKGKLRQEK